MSKGRARTKLRGKLKEVLSGTQLPSGEGYRRSEEIVLLRQTARFLLRQTARYARWLRRTSRSLAPEDIFA